jgi:membrane protein YqaA with SNARE-associated domain
VLDLLLVGLVAFVSALFPLVNLEAYLGVRASVAGMSSLWLLGMVAAFGQMLGKLAWYYLGASSLRWRWIRRRMDTPRQRVRLEHWQERTRQRPVLTGVLLFVSAVTGIPPLAILAVVAGQLRMRLGLFVALGFTGRWLRFVAVLGGAQWLTALWRS